MYFRTALGALQGVTVRCMIRNSNFWCDNLDFLYFETNFWDSRHVRLAVYTFFYEEYESAVRTNEFLHREERIKKN